MNPLLTELPVVNLRPGELFVAREPTLISTLLGSCVAVTVYCPVQKFGAMCHGVMPANHQPEMADDDCFRFVDSSITYMVDVLSGQQGVNPVRLNAKIFGGADVLDVTPHCLKKNKSIGSQNIIAARNTLSKLGLPIVAEKVGGVKGYKLFFYSYSGEVLLRHISRSSNRDSK